MKILDAGHRYEIDNIDGDGKQEIVFVKRQGDGYPFNKGAFEGTNVQELLRVLINRSQYLQSQKPCAETELAIVSLKNALFLFESRAARRHGRTLELVQADELVFGNPCKKCGHIGCSDMVHK